MRFEIDELIDLAFRHISAGQSSDGSFISLSSPSSDFKEPLQYQTVFFTSLILGCLDSHNPAHTIVASKAIGFLLEQKSDRWTFNYWSRQSAEYKAMPYPDDLDDTFCALGSLYSHRPDLFNGSVLAQITQTLISTEQKTGGPYRTWLVDMSAGEKWQDVDIAVNSNIASFLACQKVTLPKITEFVEQKIRDNDLKSPYYPSSIPVIYFISDWYQGQFKQKLVGILLQKFNRERMNLLDAALTASTLINFGVPLTDIEPVIAFIIEQYKAGGFLPHPFCFDPAKQGKQYFAGSSVLTAAFCLRALNLYRHKINLNLAVKLQPEHYHDTQTHDIVVSAVEKSLVATGPNIAELGIPFLRAMMAKDRDNQISLLPRQFAAAVSSNNKKVSTDLILRLGEANVFGWTAYTIYDHVMDESSKTELLPVAQVCARAVAGIFYTLPVNPTAAADIRQLFNIVMDEIDEADAWEVRFARKHSAAELPDYKDLGHLARRSMGHALGPLAVIISLGYGSGTKQFQAIQNLFFHYLIARQLNDDAHDWEDDLSHGQLTAVVVWLLQEHGGALADKLDMAELQKLFWRNTIHKINAQLAEHMAQARAEANRSGLFKDTVFIDNLLRPFEQSLKISQQETIKAESFINEYRKDSNLL